MKRHTLNAQKRELVGRKVKRLRKEGIVPATLYGKGLASQSVQVSATDFSSIYKEAGETGLTDLKIGESVHPVLFSAIQVHPVTSEVLHIDFREVNLKEKVEARVPVELVGESPAEKQGLGTLVLLLDEIEVKALPAELPEKFEVPAEKMIEVEQAFTVSDLAFDKSKVEILTPPDQILAKVEPPQKEEAQTTEVQASEGEAVEGAEPVAEGSSPTGETKETENKGE